MKKIIAFVVLVIVAAFVIYWVRKTPDDMGERVMENAYKNISYEIEGSEVTLVNGYAETEIPDSSLKTVTRYFGNEVRGDFDADGDEDMAFLLTEDNGGTGTFYYVVAALQSDHGYTGTNAILLGDRISPQTTEFRDGEIIVNYADRKPDEPMTASPSVGVSKYLEISEGKLAEVAE